MGFLLRQLFGGLKSAWSRFGVSVVLVSLLASCATTGGWHQKLTLHLQTPDGPAAFSSVTAMRCEAVYAMDIGGTKVTCREKGEALVAELGERHLFALLAGEQLGYRGVFEALIEDGDTYQKYWKRIKRAEGQAFDVPRDRWPMFVSFEDVGDPASVFAVDPDDLAAVFGDGYAVERLTVEVTDQPVTEGEVEAVLGWLSGVAPNQLDGSRYHSANAQNRFANSVSPYQFSTEVGQ